MYIYIYTCIYIIYICILFGLLYPISWYLQCLHNIPMWCCQLCGWCLCPWLRRWAPQWSESWCLNRCGVPCLATMGARFVSIWGISPWWKWCCVWGISWGYPIFHGGKWHFHGENDMPVYVFFFGYLIFRHVNHGYGMLWVNMVRRPTDCGEFISIPHYEPSHSMWLGPILIDFTWFSDDFRSQIRMIPKTESQMPRGSQVALALAQLSGKQQAQLRELKVELCAQGGSSRHFHVENRITSWKAAFFFIFSLDHPRSLVLSFI